MIFISDILIHLHEAFESHGRQWKYFSDLVNEKLHIAYNFFYLQFIEIVETLALYSKYEMWLDWCILLYKYDHSY